MFIAILSNAAPNIHVGHRCIALLTNNEVFPALRVYGQESEVIFKNKRGEFLILSRSEHSNNVAAERPGAIPIEYVSFKIAIMVNHSIADELRTNQSMRDEVAANELEPKLVSTVLNTIYSSGVPPTYRPAALRKSYLFPSPGGEESLLAIEHIQHLDSMTDSQRESITAKIISEFEKR